MLKEVNVVDFGFMVVWFTVSKLALLVLQRILQIPGSDAALGAVGFFVLFAIISAWLFWLWTEHRL